MLVNEKSSRAKGAFLGASSLTVRCDTIRPRSDLDPTWRPCQPNSASQGRPPPTPSCRRLREGACTRCAEGMASWGQAFGGRGLTLHPTIRRAEGSEDVEVSRP